MNGKLTPGARQINSPANSPQAGEPTKARFQDSKRSPWVEAFTWLLNAFAGIVCPEKRK